MSKIIMGGALKLDEISKMVQNKMAQILEIEPLYRKIPLSYDLFNLISKEQLFPIRILYHCRSCKAERPFGRSSGGGSGIGTTSRAPLSGIHRFEAYCGGCSEIFSCWLRFQVEEDDCWVQKIGQFPPWSISLSKDLEQALGVEDCDLYKKGRVCVSQSYGVAACACFRRILENQINPILSRLGKIQDDVGVSTQDSQIIKAAIEGRAFEDKLKLAYKVVPKSLFVDGQNPLKTIFDQLSKGIHVGDEDECIQTAMSLDAALEFVVVELSRRELAEKKFIEAIKGTSPKD